jgi:glycosyltransferase involved in cell wall biosynthesis
LNTNKVLIVAYHFPPDAAVGALRPHKFAKYFPLYGWEPHVLTIEKKYIERTGTDESNDSIIVHRTAFWRTPLKTIIGKTKRLIHMTSQKQLEVRQTTVKSDVEADGRTMVKKILWEIDNFPDDKIFWSVPALIRGYQIIKREKIQCIYATIPPSTCAIIGFLLSLLTGAKLVVDFRDPCATARSTKFVCSTTFYLLAGLLEGIVVNRARLVISTTERLTRHLQESYRDTSANKFVTITNGYDESDFGEEYSPAVSSKFIISYLGTFYMDRNPDTFFQALKTGIDEGSLSEYDLEIRLYGQVEFAGDMSTRELLKRYGLENVVKISGPVSHRQAIKMIRESDLLLLWASNQPHQIPAKAFEYIGARRPILAFTEDGATADLIRAVNGGIVVSQDDISGILQSLISFYGRRQSTDVWYRDVDIQAYSHRRLVKELDRLLTGTNL